MVLISPRQTAKSLSKHSDYCQWRYLHTGRFRRKVNIFIGDSIGNYEGQKTSYDLVSNSEWLLRYSCLNRHVPKKKKKKRI